jgi:hypothetical protein
MYGHFRTKTQMKLTPGRYWLDDPTSSLKKDATSLNDQTMNMEDRLSLIRTGNVGGILMVTRLYDHDGPTTESFITILAAPSMATYDPSSSEPGVSLDDIWDETALTGFDPSLDLTSVTRPLMAATEGYSRATKDLTGQIQDILLDAQPILIPEGQDLGRQVLIGAQAHLRAFLLPEVCNLPVGLRWPTDIGIHDFTASIKAALGKSSGHFETVIQALKPHLDEWFRNVATHPLRFQISGCRFLSFYDDHFPKMDSGEWPPSATDPEAFSPMLDMMNGFAWRVWCERQATTATVLNRNYLTSYLAMGSTAVTAGTYLGAAFPGRFCPNYAYHFKMNGWPTDSATSTAPGYLLQFERLSLISWHAQQHTRIAVNLHDSQSDDLLPLQTTEQKSSTAHKDRTPSNSRVPKDPMSFSGSNARRKIDLTTAKATPVSSPMKRMDIPSGIKPFSPAIPMKPVGTPSLSPSRRLDLDSADPCPIPFHSPDGD